MAVLATPRGRPEDIRLLEGCEAAADRAGVPTAAPRFGKVLWDIDRRPTRAYNVACALTRAGEADEAMVWLAEARKAGFDKIDKGKDRADYFLVFAKYMRSRHREIGSVKNCDHRIFPIHCVCGLQ